jgi:cytochrome oxidase Cu insertion factor (SCO1/SenC/PrrC family)
MSRAVGFWLAVLLIFSGGILAWFAKQQVREEYGAVQVPDRAKPPERSGPKLTEFELVDQNGVTMNSRELEGHVWAGSFFFAKCPSTCYNQNIKLQQLSAQFADRGLKLVSITCDPANDSPAALAEYASRFNADASNWRFLTTSTDDIEYLQRIGNDFFQLMVGPETHSDRVIVFDRQGQQRGAFSMLRPDQFLNCQKLIEQLLSEDDAA